MLRTLGRQCGWLADDEREEIFHDAYAVMLEKQRAGVLEPEAMRPEQLRSFLVRTAINKALDEGKRPRRSRSRPLGDDALAVADRGPEPDEVAATHLDDARVREIVSELPARRQAVVKLRFFLERTPDEIQRMLAISSRVYRHDLERGLRYIAQRYELVRAGTFCESREDLILAYIAGGADAKDAAEARTHLANCPGCARWAVELREAARKVGAAVPLPPLVVEDGTRGRLVEALAGLREAIADLVANGKQLATAMLTRADPGTAGYATAVRPGAVAAVVAGCITAGGGVTYCAVQGVPSPVGSLLAQLSPADAGETRDERRAGERPRLPNVANEVGWTPTPIEPPEPAGAPAQAQPREPEPAPESEPEVVAPAPQPAPRPSATEFGLNGSAVPEAPVDDGSSTASAPAPVPVPEPAPPPRPGEFDP